MKYFWMMEAVLAGMTKPTNYQSSLRAIARVKDQERARVHLHTVRVSP